MTGPGSRAVALITGGTSGIGLATARLLHGQGYAVVVTGRNPDTLAAARATLPEDVVVLAADARSMGDLTGIGTEVRDRFGRVDLAFLNAGIGRLTPLDTATEDAYDELFDINVKSHFFTLQQILPLLGNGSSVVMNSSTLGLTGAPGWSAYSATKGALVALVRSLALELAPRGIRVNAISPGPIDTPALGKVGIPADQLDAVKDGFAAMVPMGRFGTDREIAGAVAFLASAAASYITGTNLVVDGGHTAV